MKHPFALLWRVGDHIVGDFAERGAVERGRHAPLRDIVSIPPPYASSPHPPKTRKIVIRSIRSSEP